MLQSLHALIRWEN